MLFLYLQNDFKHFKKTSDDDPMRLAMERNPVQCITH